MKSINKVAIVTGGGKRLGRYISISLAENGYNIVVSYNKSALQAQKTVDKVMNLGREGSAVKADIAKYSDVKRLVEKTISKFGRIDLLINNAAVFTESPLDKTSEKIWDNTIDINLKGTFLCSKEVAPVMLNQKTGRIINIASIGGLLPWSRHLPYSVSKAGVIMLTKILAKSLAPNVQVNAIAPGTIIFGEREKTVRFSPKNKILLRKYGKPKDITDMIIFLAKSSQYITGQLFSIDGGRSIQG